MFGRREKVVFAIFLTSVMSCLGLGEWEMGNICIPSSDLDLFVLPN